MRKILIFILFLFVCWLGLGLSGGFDILHEWIERPAASLPAHSSTNNKEASSSASESTNDATAEATNKAASEATSKAASEATSKASRAHNTHKVLGDTSTNKHSIKKTPQAVQPAVERKLTYQKVLDAQAAKTTPTTAAPLRKTQKLTKARPKIQQPTPPSPKNKRKFLKKWGLRWATPNFYQFRRLKTRQADTLIMQHRQRDVTVQLHMLYHINLFGVQKHLAIKFDVLDADMRELKAKWTLNPHFKPNKFFNFYNPSGHWSYWATRWRTRTLLLEGYTLNYDRELHNELIELYQALRPR